MLEDGRVFTGEAYGAIGEAFGEAVFSTGMTGYQETLSDPSFHGQIVIMTAPHIGNTGVNDDDYESDRIQVAGFVVRDPARRPSNWRSRGSLDDELAAAGVVGISGIDTRALTRHLRERGAMRCGISSVLNTPDAGVGVRPDGDPQAGLLARVRRAPKMVGADLAPLVSTREPYLVAAAGDEPASFTVAALDLGIKRATPRALAALGCDVHVVPARTTGEQLLALAPDGVFLSNGPGDPATADYAVAALRTVLAAGVPVFGICFGHQVLARALGFETYKLTYGHRGVNQPVGDVATGRIAVTSQNHGFAVRAPLTGATDTPYGRVVASHIGLNDDVVEGLECLDVPAFSVQFHPEAAPGPHDAAGLFEKFRDLMATTRTARAAAASPGGSA
ncbi:glutamine-hydrolyzing carbamoyl-phosphate synthase small subunit [Frankia sp. R82]|uniref:glutamine-hydrolyzing carbamoyl-phosphate synthase small subunit n=1 Tax=Frankia sp. R82 TaxID=2950553 RepID=UPI002043DEAA|nr:glutamine-hydrolyzing carbamoyl-phosphate synthase small subunit [Frankia sp. R82]MCM3887394.1 glutamine-hydrolyzing carbamoyl-phosphate synthase small subunit [Frankia sp. R82]